MAHDTSRSQSAYREPRLFPNSSISRLQENQVQPNGLSEPAVMEINSQQELSSLINIRTKAISLRVSCSSWCSCVCHAKRSLRFSRRLRNIIGVLFVGYSGLPVITPPCNEKKCRQRSAPTIEITYYFPTWFLSRALSFSASLTAQMGPELILKMPRMVGWDSPVWRLSRIDDRPRLQGLLGSGEASPYDINEYGQSALHVCIPDESSLQH